jgi:cytoskeletal protein CcmA (bactofilin family)
MVNMWKARPEDEKPMSLGSSPNPPTSIAPASPMSAAKENSRSTVSFSERADVGHIGKSVVIRGQLTGSEDLYLDGDIEGTIDLRDHKLVIGPNGKIKATITARDLVVHGKVEGNVTGSERVELRKSCSLVGDISTQRIVIEDGAYFKGAIDIKENAPRKTMAASASAGSNATHSFAPASGSGSQSSFLEAK